MPRPKYYLLAQYVKKGILPDSPDLTPEQCAVVVHAPADRSTEELAADLGVSPVGVRRYRVNARRCFTCRVYFHPCAVCGVVFATSQHQQIMHPLCRESLNARWEPAADVAA